MPASIVIGGQFGSEGKGKVTYEFALRAVSGVAVRVGGPNSGHTVVVQNDRYVLRQLPTPAFVPGFISVLPAGSYLLPKVLIDEIMLTGLTPDRLAIDPDAWIITNDDLETEASWGLSSPIGSTCSGTGAAVVSRIRRNCEPRSPLLVSSLRPFVRPVGEVLRGALSNGERIIVEGTQGSGLSILHGGVYPYATSRDTNAAGFVSEAGISPLDVDEIIMVLRAFPIRVAGNSGPLPLETTWESLSARAHSLQGIVEYSTVTHRIRRVAEFDPNVVLRSIKINRPTTVVLNHLDYIDNVSLESSLTSQQEEFVARVESLLQCRIDYGGVSPSRLLALSGSDRKYASLGGR